MHVHMMIIQKADSGAELDSLRISIGSVHEQLVLVAM